MAGFSYLLITSNRPIRHAISACTGPLGIACALGKKHFAIIPKLVTKSPVNCTISLEPSLSVKYPKPVRIDLRK